jgi:hypothetical protein
MLKLRTGVLRILGLAVVAGFLATPVVGVAAAQAANIVKNGSFEGGSWMNTRCNYMAVPAGSTAITGWTVPRTNNGELAWGRATCDGYRGAKGASFVDLSGFGADATNGALAQQLTTSGGAHYKFSIDVCACNDGSVTVKVGKRKLSLSPGQPFSVAGHPWEPLTGTFKGDRLHTSPELKIMNVTPGAQIVFIDNIVIKRQ